MHELDDWDKSSFVTLTYDDEHLPVSPVGKIGPIQYPWPTLQKKEFQKFIKRVRRDLENENRKIKYFASGEYGENTERPHYHCLFFGLSLSRNDRNVVMANWPFCDWKNPQIVKGSFGLVEPDSIQYVAGYIHSKLSGNEAKINYDQQGREPVFRVGSQGLGKNYVYKNAEQLQEGYIKYLGIPHSIPRYYLNKLDAIGLRPDLSDSQYESQCDKNQKLIGLWMSDAEILRANRPDIENSKMVAEGAGKKQHGLNLKAKLALKSHKL